MVDEEAWEVLLRSINLGDMQVWNKWKKERPHQVIELTGVRLEARASHKESDELQLATGLAWPEKGFRTQLRGIDLSRVNLSGANLELVDLPDANLSGTILYESSLQGANLERANLTGAILRKANLYGVNFSDGDLTGADLIRANLVRTNFQRANLTGCSIYGISVWDVQLEGAIQNDLVISYENGPTITVDNLEVAQFIYLLSKDGKIRDIIDTLTSRAILILGRFTETRKAILDSIREELRQRDYLPIMFDFDKPKNLDLTETVLTLAAMSRFIIADITDPKSIPQELGAIIPNLRSVPIQPILLASETPYALFSDWRGNKTVLPIFYYQDKQHLLANLPDQIIEPAMKWRRTADETMALAAANERIAERERHLALRIAKLERPR